jgi:hypothetical protein
LGLHHGWILKHLTKSEYTDLPILVVITMEDGTVAGADSGTTNTTAPVDGIDQSNEPPPPMSPPQPLL